MSDIINGYRYSEINTNNISVVDEGTLEEITKLYSNDYGTWLDGSSVTLSPNKFLSINRENIIYVISSTSDDEKIIGYCSVKKEKNIILITSACIKKSYRQKGLFKSLLNYILKNCKENDVVGVITPNPIILWTLETLPNFKYIDLEEEILNNPILGLKLSILFDTFRRKSYKALNLQYRRCECINHKKLKTGFSISIPQKDLKFGCEDLGKFYSNLMGTLEDGEEWILFVKYVPKLDNTI